MRQQVCFTQRSQFHPVTRSLLLLIPFNTKAPDLHTVSMFYYRELNSLREMAQLADIQPFLALLIIHCTEGKITVQTQSLSYIWQHCLQP